MNNYDQKRNPFVFNWTVAEGTQNRVNCPGVFGFIQITSDKDVEIHLNGDTQVYVLKANFTQQFNRNDVHLTSVGVSPSSGDANVVIVCSGPSVTSEEGL